MLNKDLAQKLVEYCFDEKVLLGWTLHSDTLIRLAPPLIITNEELEHVVLTIKEGLRRALT